MDDRYEYDEDFEEEEVWATVGDIKHESSQSRRSKDSSYTSTASSGKALRQSAPLSIPNWSNAYKNKDSSRQGRTLRANDEESYVHGDDEDGADRVPPHEWLAKKMARSQASSFSVCEGAGRTLKGRDLRKVRNAVLTRTGFLE